MVFRRLSFLNFIILTTILISGCGILGPAGPLPTIAPREVATLAAAPSTDNDTIQVNLGNSVEPQRDPDVVHLMNSVSQQQLIAYVQRLQDFGTRNSFSQTLDDEFGIGAARRWIAGEFERVGGGKLQVEFQDFPLTFEGVSSQQRNVVATLPGVGQYPGVIVVGAHYDSRLVSATDGVSISPSANDNASGVAMVLEAARLLSSRTWNQTIVFVAFAAEEQGTAGSRRFVTNALIDGQRIDFAINNDGIGGRTGIPQYARLFAPNVETSPSGQAARYIEYLTHLYQPDFPVAVINALDREGRYGDQREFINAGIGAVRLIESQEDESLLNSPADQWDKIDYNYLANVTRINVVTIASWAGAPPPPPTPTVSPMAESGSYLVTWNVNLQAAGYVVVFRPINQTNFPEFRFVATADASAGSIPFTGFDPAIRYAVSVAPITPSGRLGGFSAERIIP